MSQDAKKEEFKKYLEKAGVLEVLTKSLVSLYEEPDKPGDAVNYLKKSVGGTDNDKVEIERLQTENAELKAKLAAMEKTPEGETETAAPVTTSMEESSETPAEEVAAPAPEPPVVETA